jgi:DNA-binding MarR family transcriptional regulator
MEHNLHSLLLSTQSIFHKKVFSNVSGSGLSSGQPKILDYLKMCNGCTQKEIATACEIEPATVTSLLSRMEEMGLIERKSLQGDKRSLHIYLTKQGKNAQETVSAVFEKLEGISFRGFSEQEQETFLLMLSKIYGNISSQN